MINKSLLLEHIIESLERVYQNALNAATRAYDTATNEENVAENKYDTLGLEASYLAQGQSKRVTECAADVSAFKSLKKQVNADSKPANLIRLGSLICLEDNTSAIYLLLGPSAGGLNIHYDHLALAIITPSAPLGEALLGRTCDDEFELQLGDISKIYRITAVY